jgi:hypothetical protein
LLHADHVLIPGVDRERIERLPATPWFPSLEEPLLHPKTSDGSPYPVREQVRVGSILGSRRWARQGFPSVWNGQDSWDESAGYDVDP